VRAISAVLDAQHLLMGPGVRCAMVSSEVRSRFERLRGQVEGMARRLRRHDDDLRQSGLLKLWELLTEAGARTDSYVMIAVRNAMIGQLRYMQVRRGQQGGQHCAELAGRPPASQGASGVDTEDLLQLLRPPARRAFILHCCHGHTLREAAKKLGVSKSTVHRLVAEAKVCLRDYLADLGQSGALKRPLK